MKTQYVTSGLNVLIMNFEITMYCYYFKALFCLFIPEKELLI